MITENTNKKSLTPLLGISSATLFLLFLLVRSVYPELVWLSLILGLLFLGTLIGLSIENHKALKGRSAAFGLNSFVTALLVISIVGVVNFLGSRYPLKLDLTKNKLHTLSDQSVKLTQSLKKPIKAIYFAKMNQKEQIRPLLDNYKSLNPKFEVEYVDPDREPTRAKQEGIKKYGTLQLVFGAKENKIDDANEEKITNALIKLLKEKNSTLCSTTGHGEKSFTSTEAEGYDTAKKALADQSYDVKELNLMQEGKVPEFCDAVAILGPTKAFFEPEAKILREYFKNGGRGIIAIDLNMKGGDFAPELLPILADWHIKPDHALIVDPVSRMLGVDASVAILASFSKDNPIAKASIRSCAFPLSLPLELIPGAPTGMNVQWLAQTTPNAWGVNNLKELQSGQVQFVPGQDLKGPLNAAITVEGKQKDSKATKNTRLVAFGTSNFATNSYARYMDNLDFFLNSVSWVVEDESLISIRTKEETSGKIELSDKAGSFIKLLTVFIIPFLIAAAGVSVWMSRRKL
jgi:ABC-type uncharacterized transport system involved in gliding motility auxiliary subunit